ncbi:MAG: hypothetical protein WCO05_03715 [Candidatus Moraniibacteriota bacterium]|jgi:hypothetical protein
MNLEGTILGYNKKMLAFFALVIFVAGAMFYAGAKYEKRKLSSLGLLKTTADIKTKKKPVETIAPSNEVPTNTPSEQNTATPNTTAPTAATPSATKSVTVPTNPQK